jgi:hypothetical protein
VKKIILTAAVILSSFSLAPAADMKVSKNDPIQFFLVERIPGEDGKMVVNFTPSTEKAVLTGLTGAGFDVQSEDAAPLISKTKLKYSEARTERKVSEYIGRVHIVVEGEGNINLTNDQGEKVILKTEITDVSWELDRKAAFAEARKSGAKYVLIAETTVESVRAPGAIQRSFNVTLEASLHKTSNGRVVASFSDSLTRQGFTLAAASKEAAKHLGKKMALEIQSDEKE